MGAYSPASACAEAPIVAVGTHLFLQRKRQIAHTYSLDVGFAMLSSALNTRQVSGIFVTTAADRPAPADSH